MNPLETIKEITPQPNAVERSLAKREPFAKPGAIGKPGAPTNQKPNTRVRALNWKRTTGRPRKTLRDPRKVKFF